MFTRVESYTFEYEGESITLDNSFNNVLLFYEMVNDGDLQDADKLALGVEILTGIECLVDGEITKNTDWLQELFEIVIKKLFGENKEEEDTSEKIFDFEQDSELIYASFLQDYNIDLLSELNKMTWQKFITLVRQLSDETPFKKALGYRVAKIPSENKHNRDEVKRLKKMKQIYALKQDEVKPTNNDNRLAESFEAFKR